MAPCARPPPNNHGMLGQPPLAAARGPTGHGHNIPPNLYQPTPPSAMVQPPGQQHDLPQQMFAQQPQHMHFPQQGGQPLFGALSSAQPNFSSPLFAGAQGVPHVGHACMTGPGSRPPPQYPLGVQPMQYVQYAPPMPMPVTQGGPYNGHQGHHVFQEHHGHIAHHLAPCVNGALPMQCNLAQTPSRPVPHVPPHAYSPPSLHGYPAQHAMYIPPGLELAKQAFITVTGSLTGTLGICELANTIYILGTLRVPYDVLLEIFSCVDVDKDGTITFLEFAGVVPQLVALAAFHHTAERARVPTLHADGVLAALRLAGLDIPPAKLGDICRAADANYDGQIDWREFWKVFPQVQQEMRATPDYIVDMFRRRLGATSSPPPTDGPPLFPEEQVRKAFDDADELGAKNGQLDIMGFARALTFLGIRSGGYCMIAMFFDADSNADQLVSYEEFRENLCDS